MYGCLHDSFRFEIADMIAILYKFLIGTELIRIDLQIKDVIMKYELHNHMKKI